MLKRIQRIQNIGKFADCNAAGCEFAPNVIIFGYNTQGKSTLTSIFRSLQTGNNSLLIGRKTFGATASKKIEIDFVKNAKNKKYIFQNKAWNEKNEDILIFDSKFISENIFDGESVSFDQQKNMNTIIIGKYGNDLNEEIGKLQKKCDDFETAKRGKTSEFSRYFPSIPFDKFAKLVADPDIDAKLISKNKEIKFEKDKEEIKTLIKSHILSLNSIDYSIRTSLEKTLDVKQEEIEDHVKAHFSNEENARNFLNEGLSFLKVKPSDDSKRTCVFCGQTLDTKAESLIGIYAAFFKGGYEQLQTEIGRSIDYFKRLNIEAILIKIASDLKGKDIDISLTDEKIIDIKNLKANFQLELDKKRDLNYGITFTDFDKLKTELEAIKSVLDELEKQKLNLPLILL